MNSVGAYEARTRWSELLDQVAKGETIEITRRGKAIARLVPAPSVARDPEAIKRAVEEIRAMRKGVRLRGLKIKDLINEGRRF